MTVLGTAGHVDHGKSTLVRALTGTDPDTLAAERERGLTIDLGFAVAQLPSGRRVHLVDVPGHVRFLKNMLAGAGAVSGVIFVVDAVEGPMAQSREHLMLLELLAFHKVATFTGASVVGVDEAGLKLGGGGEIPVDSIVLATGYRAENSLYKELAPRLPAVHLMGDALNPENIKHAIWSAYEVARMV